MGGMAQQALSEYLEAFDKVWKNRFFKGKSNSIGK